MSEATRKSKVGKYILIALAIVVGLWLFLKFIWPMIGNMIGGSKVQLSGSVA